MKDTVVHKLGMPYMGNKRKLAKPIIDYILKENPNCKYFYDLFGGGGSISFEAMQREQIVSTRYNELNKGVVSLLRDVLDNGVTEKYYQWIDRDTFHKHKNDDDWLGGLCKVVWSFGNKGSSYLFGKKIEADKKLLHEIIVNKNEFSLREFNKKFNVDLEIECDGGINDRRLKIMRQVKDCCGRIDLQQLEQLERLECKHDLITSALSYKDVIIDTPINETIIYLDPPYKSTGTYQSKVCHDELSDYIKHSPYKIYMSGYESDLKCVLELNHRSTLSATANNKVIEKLFTNK